MSAYEGKFFALSRYDTLFFFSPQERICGFVNGFRSYLQIPALQLAAAAKSFHKVVDFVIRVKEVKPDDFIKVSALKNFHKGGDFSGSYSRGQS